MRNYSSCILRAEINKCTAIETLIDTISLPNKWSENNKAINKYSYSSHPTESVDQNQSAHFV